MLLIGDINGFRTISISGKIQPTKDDIIAVIVKYRENH